LLKLKKIWTPFEIFFEGVERGGGEKMCDGQACYFLLTCILILATERPTCHIVSFENCNFNLIRKLTVSISRSTYLLKRRVSFLLITTGYTSHVFFFTTECCDFGDRQSWNYVQLYLKFKCLREQQMLAVLWKSLLMDLR
jgi:hypothetical protein